MFDLLLQISRDSWGLIPLMIFLVIMGLTISIERMHFFFTKVYVGRHIDRDLALIDAGDLSKLEMLVGHYDKSIQGQYLAAAHSELNKNSHDIDRQMDENLMKNLPKIDRNIWVLDTCATLGPLMGLLGTIIHMIQAFSVLSQHSAQGVHTVTGPIAHALIATAVGLCIAIICVSFLNYFNKRIKNLLLQLELIKSMLLSRFTQNLE